MMRYGISCRGNCGDIIALEIVGDCNLTSQMRIARIMWTEQQCRKDGVAPFRGLTTEYQQRTLDAVRPWRVGVVRKSTGRSFPGLFKVA